MIMKEQLITFKKSADNIFNTGDFTSATILYFKTLFAIHDFILLDKIGYAPKDHNERFRLLEKEFQMLTKISILNSILIGIPIPGLSLKKLV